MTTFVLDASVLERNLPTDGVWLAPELIDVEFANFLRKSVLRGERDSDHATDAFAQWIRSPVKRVSHKPYLATIWSLRHNITAYDASYVALAMHLGATLLTADLKLAAAAASYCDVLTVD